MLSIIVYFVPSGTLNGTSNGSNDEIGQCDNTTGQQSYLRSNEVISNLNGKKSLLLIEDTWNIMFRGWDRT